MLVGRDSERALLREGLATAQQGRGGTLVISGEAGIGKSALLADFAEYARSTGATVLTGHAVAGGGAYRPFAEALLPPVRAGRVTESPGLLPFRSVLGRVLPGWAPPGPPEPGVDPVLLLGEGLLRLLLALEGGVRVLGLEDLQLADADSLALLEFLAPAVTDLPILLVGVQGDWPPSAALDRLVTTGHATRLRLARLTPADVVALVDSVGSVPPAVRDAVVHRAEGLPLVAAELAAGFAAEGPAAGPTELVPESFAALVQARLAELTAGEQRLLAAAAVLGSPYWPLAPQVAELDEQTTTSGVRHALQLNLLVAEGGELGWRHGLTREAVLATLLPAARRQLSRRAAELLMSLGTEDADAAAADRLTDAGDHDGAARILLRLARSALAGGALRTAEDLLRRAALGRRQIEVDVLRVELLTATGRVDEALQVGTAALDAARADQHAELCLRLARAAVTAGRWGMADDFVARAGRTDDVRSLVVLADSAHGAGRVDEADRVADLAVNQARTAPPDVLCEALCVRGRISRLRNLTAARASFAEAAQLASEYGQRPWRVEALFGLGTLEMFTDETSTTMRAARETALDLGLLVKAGQATLLLADHLFTRRGPTALTEPADELAELAGLLRLPAFGFASQILLATRDVLAGNVAGMEERLRLVADMPDLPPDSRAQAPATRALAALLSHDLVAANAFLDAAAQPVYGHESTAPLAHFGLWAVVASLVQGEAEVARAALRRRPGLLRRATRGALYYADAIVAGRLGDRGTAEQAFVAGDELLARVEWWGRFLRLFTLEAAIADGWGTPVPLLRADLTAFEQDGDTQLARICRDLLRRAGAPTRRGRGSSTVPPVLRARGITSRELDVLTLVTDGLSNAAISERLFLSPRTIETHVANLLLKSGVANRQELRGWFRTQVSATGTTPLNSRDTP